MKRTIVFLHPHFLKPGGASRVVLEQASRLQKLGLSCPIITTKQSNEITQIYSNLDIHCLSPFSTGQLLFWLTLPIFLFKLLFYVWKLNTQVLYCHSISIYWGYLSKIFFPKIKLIIYFHDIGFPYFDSDLETRSLPFPAPLIIKVLSPLFWVLHRLIVKKADFLVANSQTSSKFIQDRYHRQPDTIIFPGFDQKIFYPIKTKQNYLVTAGRLEKIKNIDTIIKSLSPNSPELKIAGEGPLKEHLQSISRKLQVEFVGNLPPKKLARLFGRSKLGIFMSPAESFGLTAVECLACGTPAIGINQNGIKEIISGFDSRFLIDNSSEQLKQKIETLSLNDSGKFQSRAFDSVKKYSWDNQVRKLEKWFRTVL